MLADNIFITDHGAQRARERLGLKRRAVARAVATAWRDGVRTRDPRHATGDNAVVKIWRGATFVFVESNGGPQLITVWTDGDDSGDRLGVINYEWWVAKNEREKKRAKARGRWQRSRDRAQRIGGGL